MKKLFTLLTLLVAIVTGAQAQNASDSYLDLANVASIETAGWSKDAPGHSWDATSQTLVVNGYNAYQSRGKQKWITVDGSGSTSLSGGWTAVDVFKGSSFWGTTNNTSTLNTSRTTIFKIKGITKVSALMYTSNTARQMTMTVLNGETQVDTKTSAAGKNATDIVTIDGLDATVTYTVKVTGTDGSNCNFLEIAFVGVTATEKFTVKFDAGSNGTCATTSLTEATPGAGVTLPAVTANTGYGFTGWYTDVTDETTKVGDAGEKYNPTENITLTAGYAALAAPTISVSANATTVAKNDNVTLTATVDGTPDPTIQWYSNTSASTEGGTAIEGATATTYAPSTATPGTYYFYAVATNSQGSATSAVQTITVTASNDCVLNQVVFSNTFDAFIKAPTAEVLYTAEDQEVIDGTKNVGDVKVAAANGTIKAYYMAGTTEPTIITSTVIVSDGATYAVSDNTLTVTAEDGTTTAAYDITVEAVTPYDGVGKLTFDGTETWVKTGNAFSTASSKQGWVFSKNDSDWSRETPGKNRIYFFLAPCETVTLENGGTARNIKVYKNGTLLSTPKSTSSCTIAGDTENNFMIAIVSDQTSGDGALKSITTPVPTLTLDDTSNENATKIAKLNGKTANVTVERNLSTSYYNTLFLPFDMSAEQIQAAFGEGAQVATFTGMNSETQFGFGNVQVMEANVPYLVKPAQEVNGFTVEGVTISNTAADGVVSGGYSMVGTYDTFTNGSSTSGSSIGGGISIGSNIGIGGGSSSTPDEIYYFATTGKIKKLSSTGSIKGLRAFMVKLPAGKTSVETIVSNVGITFGGGGSGEAHARQDFVLYLDDDNTTTGIEAIENGQLTIDNDAPAYNLAGQKVGKGYKGIVIINGKKVVK